jgi:NAD-dependent dihydropyrimidine dehydrogenase PreA subunit
MKVVRKIIKIDEELCDGCGQCILSCAEGALKLIDGKVKVISDNLCDGLGACLGECPTGALEVIEREAEEFDESAVETHLNENASGEPEKTPTMACGCPSTQIQVFNTPDKDKTPHPAHTHGNQVDSALSHWPVQIRLIPPTAPFLKGSDLLVLADCVPVAFPMLHQTFLKGKTVAMGCPKFDDVEQYVEKFTEIFKVANLKSVTTVVMEVPCCAGLPRIVETAIKKSGVSLSMEQVVISTKGKILKRVKG